MSVSILSFIGLFLLLIANLNIYIPNLTPTWFELVGNISIPILLFIFIEQYNNTNNKSKSIGKLFAYATIMSGLNLITYSIFKLLNVNSNLPLFKTNIFLVFILCFALIETINKFKLEKRLSVKLNLIIFVLIELILVSSFQYDIFIAFILFVFYKYKDKHFKRNLIFIVGVIILSLLLNSVSSMTMILSIIIISEYSKLVESLNNKQTLFNECFLYNTYLITIFILNILTILN